MVWVLHPDDQRSGPGFRLSKGPVNDIGPCLEWVLAEARARARDEAKTRTDAKIPEQSPFESLDWVVAKARASVTSACH